MNVVLKNLTAGKDLYTELKDLVESEVNTEKLLEIILEKGDYTLSNSLDFKCNLIIRGNGAKIRATELANISTDDTLIAVKGKNPDLMLKVEVYDNEFVTERGILLFQNFGANGNLFVCNNIWKKSQTYNGNVRIYYPDANFSVPSIQKLIIVGNDFTDFLESQVVLNNLPDANVKVVDGNTYKE